MHHQETRGGQRPGWFKVSGPWGYLWAALAVATAFCLRLAFDPLWGQRLPYAWFFFAVLMMTFVAGPGPQVFTVVAGLALGDWFFVEPRFSFRIQDPADQVNAFLYLGICAIIFFFSARARRAAARELAARDRIAGILECTSDAVCTLDRQWQVTYFNKHASELTRLEAKQVLGRSFWEVWPEIVDTRFEAEYRRVMEQRQAVHFEEYDQLHDRWIEVHACPYGEGMATFFRNVNLRKRAEAERERLIQELQQAMAQVKTLSGLLPICAQCKRIRDETGAWNQIELYIRDRSNANFSHGICPECARRLYPEFAQAKSG